MANPVVCPNCRYSRQAGDAAPVWQCPACGIAYAKHQHYLERAMRALAPPGASDPVPGWSLDASIWLLIAANVFTLGLAYYFNWSIASLAIIYWAQSVIIGVSYLFRMLSFGGSGVGTALFFLVHYGFFHYGYFTFIVDSTIEPLVDMRLAICALGFAINHLWSYRYNRDMDRRGKSSAESMFFTPYLRILPMHIMIIFGHLTTDTVKGLLLFGALKTVADVAMHIAEHALLRRRAGTEAGE